MNTNRGKADVLFGMQRGDEGKGRFIDVLVPHYSAVARYNGGPNAGHTVVINGEEISLHQVPSGMLHANTLNICANGMVIDPIELHKEIEALQNAGVEVSPKNLAVSSSAYAIMPHHILMDKRREATYDQQGSTSTGIAFAYADKALRTGGYVKLIADDPDKIVELARQGIENNNPLGLRGSEEPFDLIPESVANRWKRQLQRKDIAKYITNTFDLLEGRLVSGKHVLLEGAQGALLDVETGMLPFVTSSDTGVAGAIKGASVKHSDIGKVYGVAKAFPSHVGGGPFLSDIEHIHGVELADIIRGDRGDIDGEYGKTTKRQRRVGFLDLPVLRTTMRFNKVDEVLLTKLDIIERLQAFGSIPVVVAYNSPEGGRLERSPSDASLLEACSPVVEYLDYLDLWDKPVKNVRRRKDLPVGAQHYLDFIETNLGIPVTMVGVGYERDELITE